MESYQQQCAAALEEALRVAGVSVPADGRSNGTVIAALLRTYATELSKQHAVQRGPSLHRFTIGPFTF